MIFLRKNRTFEGHALIETPCGTGKTMTLLSFLVAYKRHSPASLSKIVYCTRTVPEMLKVQEELRDLVKYYKENSAPLDLLSVCLSARQNMCCNNDVLNSSSSRLEVDSECRRRTATFARKSAKMSPSENKPTCSYFETLQQKTLSDVMPRAIYSLEDLKDFGMDAGLCPYFAAREAITLADVVVYRFKF